MFPPRKSLALLVAFAAGALPMSALAWWSADFKQRTLITLNTGPEGVTTTQALSGALVPLRLHSGNFDFLGAKLDGGDLRVVAADDKTPLKFWVERFDGASELAVLWVQFPTVAPGTDKNLVHVYAGNPKAGAEPDTNLVDAGATLTLHFNESDGLFKDVSGTPAAASPLAVETNGLIGASARLQADQVLELPAAERVKAAPGAAYSLSLWVRPDTAAGTLFAQGPLSLRLAPSASGAKAVARVGTVTVEGGELPVATWAQLGLTLGGGKLTLYVNGAQAAQVELPASALGIDGPVRLGGGYAGLLDEVQVAPTLRSAEWMKFTRAAQGADAKLMAAQLQRETDAEAAEGGGHGGYIGVLVKNLTVDAWVVIGILGVMFVVAAWVMVVKTLMVLRTDRGNGHFLKAFREARDVFAAGGSAQHANSSLARLYDAGVAQLRKRHVGQADAKALSGASLDAVKAAVDADLVRESHKLNAQMVLLTIAISGGPFLGLLGTVVGVMITFAAIAAAGDVNVNAIAPGIAAALLATVAGLGVAIPALFGYNYLASKIKNISADMQIFVDEFVTRVAESYGER
jgi:biopolymer transport protein ExbB